MKRILTVTVLNRPGVLNRITGLFTKRLYNIESISVGHSETEGVSRITFVVNVQEEKEVEQLTKQLNKQIHVLKVTDMTNQSVVARELALIKVASAPQTRTELNGIIDPFRATIIDVGAESVVVQVTGESEKVEAMIELLRPYGIKEIARTGTTAFARSGKRAAQPKTSFIV
ncbi:acetolactate synthase small subunit [Metabacillus sp. GX 13764]|uniref:acetolactate synthase small subunit n=1 Tax=Metabacillus kandeliae TaxID=2900151 RepID=UPI001E3BC912|nr:acetolactate synthase small subunit [Metabacillus kandeliae]MCD7032875.1 acetolactate synthase small subunit [Metabacillus kandeliae]